MAKGKNIVIITITIIIIVFILVVTYNTIRQPKGYLLSLLSRSPLKEFIYYDWDVSEEHNGSVIAELKCEKKQLILKITGSGKMIDFNSSENGTAWHQMQNMTTGWYFLPDNIVFEDDVTYIGEYAFHDFSSINQIELPRALKEIGHAAFLNCSALNYIVFDGTVDDWEKVICGNNWCSGTAVSEVKCTDGIVEISNKLVQ